MSQSSISNAQFHLRDSLELKSLASSDEEDFDNSFSSSLKGSLDEARPLELVTTARENDKRKQLRSQSVFSVFDFSSNLFPLSSSAGNEYTSIYNTTFSHGRSSLGAGSLEKHKNITFLNGLSLIIGSVIGSGIFSSPSQVNINTGSAGASLIVWIVAGILAWTGASSYAELGGAIPLNGGAQIYLAKIFGELFGFLFTWCAIIVLKPGSAAIVSIVMGEYLVRAVIGPDAESVSVWINKTIALLGLLLVTFLNCVSTKLGTKMSDLFMFMKFFALIGITITGVIVAATGLSYSGMANEDWKNIRWFEGTSTNVGLWAVALYSGLWAFDGWDNTNFVVGEFRNPTRDLPKVIHTAMPLVILCYVLANISYFFVLPIDILNSTDTVAVAFGSSVFGPVGSLVLALVVSASCFGALNASTFTSGRLTYVAGKEGYIPVIFGEIGIRNKNAENMQTTQRKNWFIKYIERIVGDEDTGLFFTPVYSMILNATLTAVYILLGELSTLVTFYGVAGYIFYFLTVLGLIILRVKEPNLERPYKTWITTPIIFCCVSLFLVSRAIFAEPLKTVIVLAFILAGIPIYHFRFRSKNGGMSGRGRTYTVIDEINL
ncbi:putative asc-type amino acid transporter 1 [Erysiphe necator]|uniref:Putative asc-type amino acid transporter 1 n=1 Tax=Uncinula necator TaxID=52586 RepID=A0A0B1P1M3_UNCNE|nr:putative asc-type amino acid transporter 1 [Erysiphe necator]